MKQDTINQLLELAQTAYIKGVTADQFARAAAHIGAFAAASHHAPHCADSAALLAASAFANTTITATTYSAQIADIANQKVTVDSNYRLAQQSFTDVTASFQEPTKGAFLPILQKRSVTTCEIDKELTSLYQTTFGETTPANTKAKQAALHAYADTYATTRSAYLRASFIANQTKNAAKRILQFKEEMARRLNKDLAYDTFIPSFFLNVMCSTNLRVLSGLMVLTSIVVITLASCGLITVAPLLTTLIIAGSAAALSSTLFVGSFFAQKHHQKRAAEYQQQVDLSLSVT